MANTVYAPTSVTAFMQSAISFLLLGNAFSHSFEGCLEKLKRAKKCVGKALE